MYMNNLLIFFAIPIAVIILSAIFETFIKSPLKVAGIFFSIFLVIAVALGGNVEYLVATIVYTIISFVIAYLVCFIQNRNYRHFCDRRNFYMEPQTPISTNNVFNNEFEVPGYNSSISENNTNTFENNGLSNNCPYRRFR